MRKTKRKPTRPAHTVIVKQQKSGEPKTRAAVGQWYSYLLARNNEKQYLGEGKGKSSCVREAKRFAEKYRMGFRIIE